MRFPFKILPAITGMLFLTVCCYSQSTTANFKTYTNSQYGFTFQYPGTWVVAEDTDVVVGGTVTARSVRFSDTRSKTSLLLTYVLAKGAGIYDFYVANFDASRNKKITVDGDEAIQVTTTDNRTGKGRLLNKKDQAKEIDVEFMDKQKTGAFELKFRAQLNGSMSGEIKKFDHLVHSFKRLK